MNEKALSELDYYRVRDSIAQFCISAEGFDVFRKLEPFSTVNQIEEIKNYSKEWSAYISFKSVKPFTPWEPIFPILKIIKVAGTVLTLEQLHIILKFLNSVLSVNASVENAAQDLKLEKLRTLIAEIPDLSLPHKQIMQIITADGKLKDLPQLREIQQRIAGLNSKIKAVMNKFITDSKYSCVLETNLPVLRNGRQVLAVKTDRRSIIPGIIHEISGSGMTSYIEPEEAVICSNSLIQAEFELQSELRKILAQVTDNIRTFYKDFIKALKIMEKLDCTFAAALWGKQNNCNFALYTEEEPLMLKKARHPLLGEKCVPIDIGFLEGKKILIITGPNTGGKTVTLKTIALLVLLNQTGFPIPAEDGSRLPIFTNIFANIGDEQSLDQSLSTFSAQMKNISEAVKNADESSLVLLDELGSGTDPMEGAAISMAVLDALIEKNASVLITTHQGVIKNYGYTHTECINASVEFNSDKLTPTYKLLICVPGESHALDIAESAGLPYQIVEKAKTYITSEKADVSSLIKGLTEKHAEAESLKEAVEKRVLGIDKTEFELEHKKLALRKKELELKQGFIFEYRELLQESRKKLENLVKKIKEGNVDREKTIEVKQFLQELNKKVNIEEEQYETEKNEIEKESLRLEQQDTKYHGKAIIKKKQKNSKALAAVSPVLSKNKKVPLNEFKVGAEVLAGKSKLPGIITEKAGKGRWKIAAGSITITMKESELKLTEKKHGLSPDIIIDYAEKNGTPPPKPQFELKLIGMRKNEAIKALERQLDLCAINNFKQFSIIHGKGDGILQQAVHHYLSSIDFVEEFKFASPEDGASGKTYIKLK